MDPFYKRGLALIQVWTSNHMPSAVWDEMTYPYLKLRRLYR